jgi:hypothetical protein
MVLWKPGFPEWERKIMLAPRTLSVVTGHPGQRQDRAVDPDLVKRR